MSAAHAILVTARDHLQAGRVEQAITAVRRLLQKEPRHAEANHSMAVLLYRAGQMEQSLYYIRQAIRLAPTIGDYHATHARILLGQKRRHAAADALREAVRVEPRRAAHRLDLMPLLWEQADYQGALEQAREAVAAEPENVRAQHTFLSTLTHTGSVEECLRQTLTALEQAPTDSSLLALACSAANYSATLAPERVFELHRRYGRAIQALVGRPAAHARPGPDQAERRLRIGYISPDLYTHSVAYFFEPILRHHDRSRFEVLVYSVRPNLDDTTRRLMSLAGPGWRDLGAAEDPQVLRALRADNPDILVDLAGHTGPNQPWLMAHKAAPVQVTAIGYPNTTGLETIDLRIVDSQTDPPGADALATERLERIDPCFLCYTPPLDAPEPAPPPSQAAGRITFGSFNNCIKLSEPLMQLWARLLNEVPGSRLLVKSVQFAAPMFREIYAKRFEETGVDPARLELVGRIESTAGHLGAYAKMDIALDPFPYDGTTTTCEALWMGVPVITLTGRAHAGRVGVSLLAAAGLSELIARNPDEYIAIAKGLASDPARLAALRSSIRPKLAASPLCDGVAYARRLEEAYRAAWRRWCAPA